MSSKDLIKGGYIIVARKIKKSGIFDKPPLFAKLWVWMLLQASFKDHGDLKRGQFFTTLERMRDAMSHKVGYRLEKPTIKEIRSATKFLTKHHMIGTTKVTHGMVVTILNYDYYQDFQNYEGHNEGHTEGHIEGTISRNKGSKERNTPSETSGFIYEQYLSEIAPKQKSRQRAIKNIGTHLKNHTAESLKASIINYAKTAKGYDPAYRKDPANFFGRQDPAFLDYLPENFMSAEVENERTPEWF